MAESLRKQLAVQEDLYEKIKRAHVNYTKSPKERITGAYVEARIETLENYWQSFNAGHDYIIGATLKETRSDIPYFIEEIYGESEELYYKYKGELKTALLRLTPITEKVDQANASINQKASSNEIKLPRITIPTFSGNYTDWQSFHDLFVALIHKNQSLEDVQKLHYLKSNLTGEAELLLRQFPITGDSYAEAWNILKRRYSNKRYISNCIFKRLFAQRIINQESAAALKQLLDTSVECLNALSNLGLPTEHWDAIIIYIMVSKLDAESHKQWEETISLNNSEEVPKFSQLKAFLEIRFRTIEMLESSNKVNRFTKPKTFHTAMTIQCALCNENHYIYNCKKFIQLPTQERYQFVQSKGLCFNCLVPNHTVLRCKQSTSCKICHRRHHSLLHPEKHYSKLKTEENVKEQEEKETTVKTHFSRQEQPGQNVLLATALVDILSRNGFKQVFRALIDQGSQASFVTEKLVQMLGLRRTRINGEVSGIGEGQNNVHSKYMVTLRLSSRYDTAFTVQVKAYVLNSLTGSLPTQEVNLNSWPELNKLNLADPAFCTPGRVDVLLGADVYSHIIDVGLLKGPPSVIAQCTHLGWIISGDTVNRNTTGQHYVISMHLRISENELLKKFWELEDELSKEKKIMTKEEEQCEEIYKNTTKKDSTGRYVVHLPLKETYPEVVMKCGDTKKVAAARFTYLEKRFAHNENLRKEYRKVIEEYKELGHMVKVEENENFIYLPHHAVIKEDRDTTKVRVVYDASAKGTNGYSLNDFLMIGPTIQPDLRTLITRWRSYKICMVADIVKMYRQIRVADKHTNLQTILWRDDPEMELQTYKLLTVTFGTASAPYLAVKTLSQIANDEGHQFPVAAEIVKNSFYMDDLMTGCDDLEQAVKIYEEITTLLKLGGFVLQKWSSNCNELLTSIKGDRDMSTDQFEIKLDPVIKILGLTWDRCDDMFKFKVNLPPIQQLITKRTVLSDVARLFDPFGWLAPVIIIAKIFIQKLWLCSASWDEELPCELINEWVEYRDSLHHLNTIQVSRWLFTSPGKTSTELHGFSDASQMAYAAVVYSRTIDSNGEVQITLIAAKTKVAPLKQVSIPRLELCGAVLLSRLLKDVAETLGVSPDQIYAWCDSTVVLSWLQAPPSKWQTFIGNRVSEITRIMDNDKWRHVSSIDNPADLGSRGVKAKELLGKEIWWKGPHWLKEENIKIEKKHIPPTELEMKKNPIKMYHTETKEEPLWERFSTLPKLKRVTAYCRRFLKRESKDRQKRNSFLTTEELTEALEVCIKYYQEKEFIEEIKQIKGGGGKKGKLIALNPFFDTKGILRVGGRIQQAELSSNVIHPIIIPRKCHLTKLLIDDIHHRTLHGGIQLMMSLLRTHYWIIGMKTSVKQCIRECVVCVRHKALTQHQLMGQLPAARVNPARAFLNSGVDYAGPIQIRMSKGRGYKTSKGYICLFICMSTRAIHLEAVTDLSSQAFIAAFRRFVSRRGHCSNLWSDNGTNFVGAARELGQLFEKGKASMCQEVAEYLANEGTMWHFIPPRAPHFGGLWEAGVKSTKMHLMRVVGNSTLTYEEISTLLAQIEACLNSRPMYRLDDTPDTLAPLTPGHFLIGESIVAVPDITYKDQRINLLDRWQLLQRMTQHFWQRWSTEYLHTLQQRYKWQTPFPDPNIGDVVVIKNEGLPPTKWLLGIVTELYPGPDGRTRVVALRCKGGAILKRPLAKLVFLPRINEQDTSHGGRNEEGQVVLGGRNVYANNQ